MAFGRLIGLAAGGAAATGIAVGIAASLGAEASNTRGCDERGWPRTVAGAPLPSASPAGPRYFVSHDGTGWRVRVSGSGSDVLTGTVTASRRLTVLRASDGASLGLQRRPRGFSFRFAGNGTTEQIRFKVACASRLSFAFGGGSAYLGSRGAAPAPSFQVSRPPRTGVSGRIIVGPTCPVVTPDCPPARPARGTVRIETAPETRDSGPGQFVKRVDSDDNGAFATDLEPGAYLLVVEQDQPGPPVARPQVVRVDAGVESEVTLALDTGIRSPASSPPAS